MFRPVIAKGLGEKPRWKGRPPGSDMVLKFCLLLLQSLHGLSREEAEYIDRDRLSWMGFCEPGEGQTDHVSTARMSKPVAPVDPPRTRSG